MKKGFLLLACTMLLSVMVGCAAPQSIDTPDENAAISSVQQVAAEEEDVLVPIYPHQIQNGTYEIEVDSSSSMFRVVHCTLIVEEGTMYAVMTMSGNGYGFVYMGTGEEALADSEDAYVPFVLDEQEAKTFTVPVEALDTELDCAAWSIRKEKWYDRTLIFMSELIPEDAITME